MICKEALKNEKRCIDFIAIVLFFDIEHSKSCAFHALAHFFWNFGSCLLDYRLFLVLPTGEKKAKMPRKGFVQ
jgi:hypothetical protein